jgi:hypothetical protein
VNRLMETALVCFLVNLCAADLVTALDDVDGRLFVYKAVFDEWFDSFGDFHRVIFGTALLVCISIGV